MAVDASGELLEFDCRVLDDIIIGTGLGVTKASLRLLLPTMIDTQTDSMSSSARVAIVDSVQPFVVLSASALPSSTLVSMPFRLSALSRFRPSTSRAVCA